MTVYIISPVETIITARRILMNTRSSRTTNRKIARFINEQLKSSKINGTINHRHCLRVQVRTGGVCIYKKILLHYYYSERLTHASVQDVYVL